MISMLIRLTLLTKQWGGPEVLWTLYCA